MSDGGFAYLGAMGNGRLIFDVKDPSRPQPVSRLIPSLHFPDARPDPTKINARGLEVVGNTVYLCYDAGGLRIVDVADRAHPREVGRYSNPVLNGKPRAYNNVVVDGALAYLGFDYCGVEVLNVGDASRIQLVRAASTTASAPGACRSRGTRCT